MNKFATAINCIDGRVQIPVNKYLKNKTHADYIDTITTPGADKLLSEQHDKEELRAIKKKIEISVNGHQSNTIAIIGHYDCLGNPVSEKEHFEQIKKACKNIKNWFPHCKILGLWVNNNWEVEELTTIE